MATALAPYRPDRNPLHETIARALVRTLQEAFNSRDPKRLARSFAHQAVWTNAMGVRLVGQREMEKRGDGLMPRLSPGPARYEVVDLLAIRHDVLAVNVLQSVADSDVNAAGGTQTMALYVLAREDGGWKVAAGQNTLFSDLE